jgi:YfiH family protein
MQLAELHQCHTDILHVVNAPPKDALRGDALITRRAGLLLAVKTADCVPVLLADTKGRGIAAVHAGWRGTLARIVQKTLGRMQMEFGTEPEDVIAVLGPAIGRCCYEVGPEVAQAFAAQFDAARQWFDGPFEKVISDDSPNPLKWLQMTPPGHDLPPPRVYLDLHAANRWQLAQAGVHAGNIFASDLCTACRTDLLFSHRRERGRTGRMMGVIGIRGPAKRGR